MARINSLSYSPISGFNQLSEKTQKEITDLLLIPNNDKKASLCAKELKIALKKNPSHMQFLLNSFERLTIEKIHQVALSVLFLKANTFSKDPVISISSQLQGSAQTVFEKIYHLFTIPTDNDSFFKEKFSPLHHWGIILDLFDVIDAKDNLTFFEDIEVLYEEVKDTVDLRMVIDIILEAETDERSLLLNKIAKILSDKSIRRMGLPPVLLALFYVAPQYRMYVADDFSDGVVWNYLRKFFEDENKKQASYSYLITKLETLDDHPLANKIANDICNHRKSFHLFSQKHPLLSQALIYQTSFTNCKNFKKPYVVFKKLKKLDKKKFLATFPLFPFQGEEVYVNQKAFIALGLRNKILYKNLPKNINKNFLKVFIEKFLKRITKLSPFLRQKVFQEIKNLTGLDYETLYSSFFDHKDIQGMLTPLNGDVVASSYIAKLYILLDTIDKIPDSFSSSSSLTDKEKAFFSTARNISTCSIGKIEGIHQSYALLDSRVKQRWKHVVTEEKEQGVIEITQIVDDILLDFLEEIFSERSDFLKKILEKDSYYKKPSPHQYTFLKNLIAKRVGLPHMLTLDNSVKSLTPYMLQYDVAGILNLFYEKYCTPEQLIVELKKKINTRMLEEGFSSNLMDFLKRYGISETLALDFEKMELTFAGALEILLALGYLNSYKKRELLTRSA